MRPGSKEEWKRAVNEAWEEHHLGTYRDAAERTDIAQTVLYDMKRYGRIPSETTIRKWAFALQEDPQKWINLAVNPKPDLDEVMVHLHATYNLSDAAMEQVRRIIEEEEEKHRRGEPH